MKYELESRNKGKIIIVSNRRANIDKKSHLIIEGGLFFEYTGDELRYWYGRFIKTNMFVCRLYPGKPYKHLFQIAEGRITVEISSNDQETFEVRL